MENQIIKLGWTAGIIDGEGCICIYNFAGTKKRILGLRLCVGNTDARMIRKLKELWGGWIYPIAKTKCRKPFWNWVIQGKKAASILIELLPYLVAKKEQAKLGIEFAKTIKPGKRTPEPIKLKRENMFVQLRKLKQA